MFLCGDRVEDTFGTDADCLVSHTEDKWIDMLFADDESIGGSVILGRHKTLVI